MIGIISCRVYLPRYFMTGEMLAQAWGTPPNKLARRVAGFDEDPLTLAAQASLGMDDEPQAVYFASTTSPYEEKSCATILAALLDLPPEARTVNLAGSLRCATSAIIAASDSIKAGSIETCLVAAGDSRQAEPGSPEEIIFGDAGAAVMLGEENLIAKLLDYVTLSSEFLHSWRREGDPYVRSGDVRFSQQYGYVNNLTEAVEKLLSKLRVRNWRIRSSSALCRATLVASVTAAKLS